MRSRLGFLVLVLAAVALPSCRRAATSAPQAMPVVSDLIAFTNDVRKGPPWSIYVARIPRAPDIEIHSMHALNGALGLSSLSEQVRGLPPALGTPLAAVNGDFYQRERAYAGDPRGLQIIDGELLSAPSGTSSVWVDGTNGVHAGTIQSLFTASWQGGRKLPIGLNEERHPASAVLFTPAIGSSTRTSGGTELVLHRQGAEPWLPLRAGESIPAVIAAVRDGGNTSLAAGEMVLSIGPDLVSSLPPLATGTVIRISTAAAPDLRGARTAISGGPVLIHDGRALKIDPTGLFDPRSYSARSMMEEHPRTAFGWNDKFFYFVEVDGRQAGSIGMTLGDLRDYMLGLGCTEAMNLDGGGSATLWCNGSVANRPCEGRERPIANGLVATQKSIQAAKR